VKETVYLLMTGSSRRMYDFVARDFEAWNEVDF